MNPITALQLFKNNSPIVKIKCGRLYFLNILTTAYSIIFYNKDLIIYSSKVIV